jgi:hypothetical protein
MPRSDTSDPYFGLAAESAGRDPRAAELVRRFALTADQCLALGDTPVELVPAPGAGRAIWLHALLFRPVAPAEGDAPYATSGAVSVGYGDDQAVVLSNSLAPVLTAEDVQLREESWFSSLVGAPEDVEDKPITLSAAEDVTDGTRAIEGFALYMIV